ncbi:hemicentin-1-like isoform X1 [Ruditapes philippinarum]|uniref:hemicentin-1-like isoform X1 n=1 Tax=Ruditapes philippinarum TaxID=129788 RepID=UPI00295B3AF6|nr:hemicentin-1-like isoform X1 [Ruditapes philippinarum]
MQNWKFHFSINALCFIHGVSCQSIVLTPTKPYVDINEALTLTCTYIGYNNVAGTKWNVNNEVSPTTIRHQDNTCSGSGIFADYNIYRVGCPSDTSFTVTILRVQQEDLNISWQCFDRDRTSNTVRILVKVSVANVVLSGPSSRFIKEQSRQTIKCKTSPGRPQPRVSWYLYESNKGVKHKITVNSSTQILNESEDGLVAVESTLQFYPNRSINNWMLNCEAWTDDETRAVHSNILTLNIAYPPQKPVIIGFTDGERYSLIESEFSNLSCSSHDGNPLANLTWNCYNSKQTSVTIEDKSVTSTVTWSGFRDQSSCSCISKHSWSGSMQTTTVMIDVLYPPSKPIITIGSTIVSDVINVILNKTLQVKCESKSNPSSNYSWIGPHDLRKRNQILEIKINGTIDRMFKCIATNNMFRQNGTHVDGRNESAVKIKVLYPPSKPYFIYEYSNGTKVSTQNMIDVIAGDSFSVHCNAAGNPLPTYMWNSNERNSVLKISSISFNTNKTCNAMNIMEETVGERLTASTSSQFSIRVLYPPHIPTITISNGTRQINVTTPTIQLKERDNINMTCFSKGNPFPNYTWDSPNDQIQENIRQFANISRQDSGNYTCYVSNLMKRTFGDTENGLNISSIYLDILYPSTISSLEDVSILEGSNLNVTCQIQRGNPTTEIISWTRPSDSKNWWNSRLTITNVSRADDTNYTCTLQNTIIPTIGGKTLAITSRTIHLNVVYKALILKYSVLNSGAHDSVTVAENETVSLQCEIEGNPTPTCEIYNEHNSDMEHHIKYSHYYATCFINFKASCLHFGVYKCKGANVINTPGYTEKTINIFVECSPRPSPSVSVMNHVIAEMNASVSLYFTALSYPKPNSVLWSKFDGKSWKTVNESNNIRIYQSNLDFGMTIIRASKADFGEYKLFISNIIGSYTHIFYIEHSMVSSKSDVQGHTGLIIGLTIVVIFLATIVSVFGVILYKRRRNLKRPDADVNNSYLNVSGANTQQKSDDKEYEMIGSNMKDSENKVNGNSKSIEDMEKNNDISVTYEKLTDDRKDINQYSQICYMKETQHGDGNSMSSGKDEQHAELSKIYINMKI